MDLLAQSFERIGVIPEVHEHEAVATVQDAQSHWAAMSAVAVKNLFLKDEAGAYCLVVARAATTVDLKALRFAIGMKRLRFASADDLDRLLGVEPGAVSPLAVIHDPEQQVALVLDQTLLVESRMAVHPNRNTATWVISGQQLSDWLQTVRPGATRVIALQ